MIFRHYHHQNWEKPAKKALSNLKAVVFRVFVFWDRLLSSKIELSLTLFYLYLESLKFLRRMVETFQLGETRDSLHQTWVEIAFDLKKKKSWDIGTLLK